MVAAVLFVFAILGKIVWAVRVTVLQPTVAHVVDMIIAATVLKLSDLPQIAPLKPNLNSCVCMCVCARVAVYEQVISSS